MDELKKRQVIARKRGYGPDYVNLFVKHHKEKMCEFARQRGICNPIDVGLNKPVAGAAVVRARAAASAGLGRERKKRERVIYKTPPVMCECGVKSNYGLVPSELGIGHWCGHMVVKSYFLSFAKTYDLLFHLNRALGNASENLMMVKLSSWMN